MLHVSFPWLSQCTHSIPIFKQCKPKLTFLRILYFGKLWFLTGTKTELMRVQELKLLQKWKMKLIHIRWEDFLKIRWRPVFRATTTNFLAKRPENRRAPNVKKIVQSGFRFSEVPPSKNHGWRCDCIELKNYDINWCLKFPNMVLKCCCDFYSWVHNSKKT